MGLLVSFVVGLGFFLWKAPNLPPPPTLPKPYQNLPNQKNKKKSQKSLRNQTYFPPPPKKKKNNQTKIHNQNKIQCRKYFWSAEEQLATFTWCLESKFSTLMIYCKSQSFLPEMWMFNIKKLSNIVCLPSPWTMQFVQMQLLAWNCNRLGNIYVNFIPAFTHWIILYYQDGKFCNLLPLHEECFSTNTHFCMHIFLLEIMPFLRFTVI